MAIALSLSCAFSILLIVSSFASALPSVRVPVEQRMPDSNRTRRADIRRPTGQPSSTFSTDWGGAVLNFGSDGLVKVVTGSVVLPSPKLPGGLASGNAGGVTIGIGLDGSTCGSASFQVGIDITTNPDESVRYDAWFWWDPGFPVIEFNNAGSDITFSPGDPVSFQLITFESTSRQQGVAIVTNGATGALAVEGISAAVPICGEEAEWIVQNFDEDIPLTNFGTLTFTDAVVLVNNGDPGNLPAATGVNLFSPSTGQQLTTVSTTASTVTVKYVGP